MERARSLDPNLAILWGGAGLISVCPGQPDVGIKQIEHAMRLSPLDPSMGLWQQGIALGHLYTGATKTQFCGQQCRCEMGGCQQHIGNPCCRPRIPGQRR